jgi:hypothetical protein
MQFNLDSESMYYPCMGVITSPEHRNLSKVMAILKNSLHVLFGSILGIVGASKQRQLIELSSPSKIHEPMCRSVPDTSGQRIQLKNVHSDRASTKTR